MSTSQRLGSTQNLSSAIASASTMTSQTKPINTSRSNKTVNASSTIPPLVQQATTPSQQQNQPLPLVQTIPNTFSANNLKHRIENHQLFCSKHASHTIDRICLHPNCDAADILFCDECTSPDSSSMNTHNHAIKHAESIFAYTDFIRVCKQNSCQHSDSLTTEKSFTLVVGDLDQKTTKFKEHIRQEEAKIDADFDELLAKITTDINNLRAGLKQQLNLHWTNYASICAALRAETSNRAKESASNLNLSNQFDVFLDSLATQSNAAFNFKKIFTNIRPTLLKHFTKSSNPNETSNILQQMQQSQRKQAESSSSFNMTTQSSSNSDAAVIAALTTTTTTQQPIQNEAAIVAALTSSTETLTTSDFSQPTQSQRRNLPKATATQQSSEKILQASSQKSVNRFESNLQDQFSLFQTMTAYKPIYKNEGEANGIFRTFLSDFRKQYFHFLDSLPKFISLATNPAASANGYSASSKTLEAAIATSSSQPQFQNYLISSQSTVSPSSSSSAAMLLLRANSSITNSQAPNLNQSSTSSSQMKSFFATPTIKSNVIASAFTPFNNVYSRQLVPTADQINDNAYIMNNIIKLNNEKHRFTKFDHLLQHETNHQSGIAAVLILDALTQTLATAGNSDKSVRIFTKEFTEIASISFETPVNSLGLLQPSSEQSIATPTLASSYLLVGLTQAFAVVRLADYSIVKTIDCSLQQQQQSQQPHSSVISRIIGLSDGQTVLTVSSSDSKLIAWNLFNNELKQPRKYFEHREGIQCLEELPNRRYVATAGKDRSIKVWALHFYKNFLMNALEKLTISWSIENAHTSDVTALRGVSSYENILLSGSANGEIKIWDSLTRSPIQTIRDSSGWVFNIVVLERPHLARNVSENNKPIIDSWKKDNKITESNRGQSNSFVSPSKKQSTSTLLPSTPRTLLTPTEQKKTTTKAPSELLSNLAFLTASFDGMIKLWEGTNGNAPICSTMSKNIFECYPFGGVAAYSVDQQLKIITSGNAHDDHTLHLWTLN